MIVKTILILLGIIDFVYDSFNHVKNGLHNFKFNVHPQFLKASYLLHFFF